MNYKIKLEKDFAYDTINLYLIQREGSRVCIPTETLNITFKEIEDGNCYEPKPVLKMPIEMYLALTDAVYAYGGSSIDKIMGYCEALKDERDMLRKRLAIIEDGLLAVAAGNKEYFNKSNIERVLK